MKLNRISFFLLHLFIMIGGIGFLIRLIQKVWDGHGRDYYLTGRGYQVNHIGVLATLIAAPVLVCIAWVIQKILDKKEDWKIERYQELMEKKKKDHDQTT